MPTSPTTPNTNSSVDRLALGVDSPRGTQPSAGGPQGFMACFCFEAEASSTYLWPSCFEAEASTQPTSCYAVCGCFETE